MKKSFLALLRSKKVVLPIQANFSPDEWRKAFNKASDTSEEAQSLYNGGLLIFAEITRINELLEEPVPFSKEELIRSLCGAANKTIWDSWALTLINVMEEDVPVEALFSAPMKIGREGENATSKDIIEAAVDALNQAIPYIATWDACRFLGDESSSSKEKLEYIRRLSSLQSRYSWMVHLWNECLWNGYRFVPDDVIDAFRAPETSKERNRFVSLFRQEALMYHLTKLMNRRWKAETADDQEGEVKNLKSPILTRKGFRFSVRASEHREVKRIPPSAYAARAHLRQLHIEHLLDVALKDFDGFTLNEMLDAWELILLIAEPLMHEMVNGDFEREMVWDCFSIVFDRDELRDYFDECLGLETGRAARLVEVFVAKNRSTDLQMAPLRDLGGGKLFFFPGVALTANLGRNVERWLQSGGFELEDRGATFEKDIHDSIASALGQSQKIDDWDSTSSFFFEDESNLDPDERKQQIDLLIRIGKTILLGEVKCLLQPFNANTTYHHYNKLSKAIGQARYKAEWLRTNWKMCEKPNALADFPLDAPPRIVPFVITNQNVGAGYVEDGIGVTDGWLLGGYLREGYHQQLVHQHADGRRTVGRLISFYENAGEAEENIEKFFCHPPQLKIFENHLTDIPLPFPPLSVGDRALCLIRRCVVMPLEGFPVQPGVDAG